MIQYVPVIGGLLEKWLSGRTRKADQNHAEQMAVYDQFGSEFRDLAHRTWWDSFIDGLNRLPRPVMTFGVIWLFWYAVDDPAGFTVAAQALAAVPYEMWVLLWMVTGFWFGTKAIEKMPKRFGRLSRMPVADIVKKQQARSDVDRKKSTAEEKAVREDIKPSSGQYND